MNNPYRAPNAALADMPNIVSDETYEPAMFSTEGRIGRLRYLTYSFLVTLTVAALAGALAGVGAALLGRGNGAMSGTLVIVMGLVIYIPVLIVSFTMMKRRLNDLNHTGWLSLLMLVPFLNILMAFYLMLWPGSKGGNSYGPKPGKNSWAMIIFGLILPMLLIGILAAAAIPEFQKYVARAQQAAQQTGARPAL